MPSCHCVEMEEMTAFSQRLSVEKKNERTKSRASTLWVIILSVLSRQFFFFKEKKLKGGNIDD